MTRFWSDEAYSQFYERSQAEQGLLNPTPAAKHRRGGELSRRQLEDFQHAFAEWSEGRGGVREIDFRRFLLQVGVDLSQAQARCLWAEVAGDARAPRLSYDQALSAYQQVLDAPVQFRSPPGAAPPGKPMVNSYGALSGSRKAAEEARRVQRSARPPDDDDVSELCRRPARSSDRGLGLSHAEVRELLLAEGIPLESVQSLLARFADEDVPQAVLFDFLTEQTGSTGEPDAAEPTSQ